jgi:hypothetical protein
MEDKILENSFSPFFFLVGGGLTTISTSLSGEWSAQSTFKMKSLFYKSEGPRVKLSTTL